MGKSVFRFKEKPETKDKVVFRLNIDNQGHLHTAYIPVNSSGYYVLCSSSIQQKITSEDVLIEELNMIDALIFWVRSFFSYSKYSQLSFSGFLLLFYGSKKERKGFLRLNRFMSQHQMPFGSNEFLYIPELFEGWNDHSYAKNMQKVKINSKIAIVVHCYYQDLWPEITHLLSGINFDFDLLVTIVEGNQTLEADIKKTFPSVKLYLMGNKGRDVLPFLYLLELGILDSYDYICKIHGKKSHREGYHPIQGLLWRRWLFFDLLGSHDSVMKIINMFEQNPHIGMIGSARNRRRKKYSIFAKRSQIYKRISNLSKRVGIPLNNLDLDFFNGTMFWIRPKCLDPIRNLHLLGEFEEECNLQDGALEHAIERFFSVSVQYTGFSLAEVDFVSEYGRSSQ
ncbi:MAG: hypothetical protein EU981_02685 [Candidatus Liberibacter ctenarytainae]|uniref:Rhamnan synthesis protein F n=1 Tax=Candidatus Liberibacter ctenarytainae TaxID=2020335 RepID=A0A937DLW1_9HYPH|nr:hypothetical protein [Candidatus Liberibacter ctenarytainae]